MLEINAEAFFSGIDLLGQVQGAQPRTGDVTEEENREAIEAVAYAIDKFREELESLEQWVTLKAFDRTFGKFKKDKYSSSEFLARVAEVRQRFFDSIDVTQFLCIEAKDIEYYKHTNSIFDVEIPPSISGVTEDFDEAGKCIALERYTASVFHIGRFIEKTVIKIGDELGCTTIDKHGRALEWGKITANIRNKLDNMDPGDKKEKWSQVHAWLVSIKDAWRNPTMHPKRTYTEKEAKAVYQLARSYANHVFPLF
jgi:hypothetical protein